jgi:hypothetical protein
VRRNIAGFGGDLDRGFGGDLDRLGRPNDLDRVQRALANRMIRYWFWKELG